MKRLILFLLLIASSAIADSKVLVYGKVLSSTESGSLVSCEPAHHSHPTGYYGIADSKDRVVFLPGVTAAEKSTVSLVGFESGEHTYTTVLGVKNTVAQIVNAQTLPAFSTVTPLKSAGTSQNLSAQKLATQPAPVPRSEFGTVMDTPRYNLDTELTDLKIGISAEKARRILGNPLRVNPSGNNGEQWCYARGQVYVEGGVVVALQNFSGDVFDATWKK
jgi:hypothetical protein